MNLENLVVRSIELYQRNISKIRPVSPCKFEPSCSEYMKQAIKKKKILKGVSLGIYRILRCNMFSKGGKDFID